VEKIQEETYFIQKYKGCDLKGHTKENCWTLYPKKHPKYFQKEEEEGINISGC
jgi:hypothetical protein